MPIPVPNPKLRVFFRGASSARYTLGMIRTLEARCNSLFESNSELLIFSEDDLVHSLLKPLRTGEILARFGNRAQLRQGEVVDIKPHVDIKPRRVAEARAQLDEISNNTGGRSTRDTLSSKLSSFHHVDSGIDEPQVTTGESNGVAEAKFRLKPSKSKTDTKYRMLISDRVATTPCTDPIQARSPLLRQRPEATTNSSSVEEDVYSSLQTRKRVSEHKTLLITRTQARDHFDRVSDRAGLRSSWNQSVIAGRADQPLAPALAGEVALVANPHSSNAFTRAETNDEQSSTSVFSGPAVRSAFVRTNTRIQSKFTHPSGLQIFDGAPAHFYEASPESPLERMIHSPASLSQPKTSMRESPAASFRGSETDETNLTYEQPLTGLRRLAAMGVNMTEAGAVQRNQQTTADNERTQSGISELPVAHFARTEEAEFGAGLTDFLRQEMLRHGIGLESS